MMMDNDRLFFQQMMDLAASMVRKTDGNYIFFGGIGRDKRATVYCIDTDTVVCGCFTGTLAQFESAIEKTHKNNPHHKAEYEGAVAYIKAARKAQLLKPAEPMKTHVWAPEGLMPWQYGVINPPPVQCNTQADVPVPGR